MKYQVLAETYHAIEKTSKRLEKTRVLATLLQQASQDELARIMVLVQGKVRPAWQKETMGVSAKLMLKALARTTGASTNQLQTSFKELGDLGLVAKQHSATRSQQTLFSQPLTLAHVHEQLKKLATIQGVGSQDIKLKTISELLSNASDLEACYITRTVLEELRIGIASSTIRDAIIYAFLDKQAGIHDEEITDRDAYNEVVDAVQSAYDKTNDFTQVALAATKGIQAINDIHITLHTPIKVMLGYKGTTPLEAMNDLGTPILLQYKYDGFRVEIHKQGNDVSVFTRRLEDVTTQFPDIVESVRKHVQATNAILDAEAIGIDPSTGAYLPFQHISQRIRRKYDIDEVAKKLPVDVRIFDALLIEDEELLDSTLEKRFAQLKEIIEESDRFGIAQTRITSEVAEADEFFLQAQEAGTEGLFAKKLTSTYQPGTRVGTWIKLKTSMEPLDVVVIGAEWGEGKRSGWLTSYEIAVLEQATGEYVGIGKVATGLKELSEQGFSFEEITELLSEHIEYEEGRYVKIHPHVILEVAYEEIQTSPSYESGYALRFPRIRSNRTDDKPLDEISTLHYVQQLYDAQSNESNTS